MRRSLVELESIVRKSICQVCTDHTAEGACGLQEPSACALFHLFPQVAQAIQSARSNDIQRYVDAIRRDVCQVCAGQTSEGYCEARQQVRCALDAYLLLVVDAVEGVADKAFNQQGFGGHTGSVARSGRERQHRQHSGGKA